MRLRMNPRRRPLSFLKAASTDKVSPVLLGWAPNGLPLLQLRRINHKNIVNGQAEAGGGRPTSRLTVRRRGSPEFPLAVNPDIPGVNNQEGTALFGPQR